MILEEPHFLRVCEIRSREGWVDPGSVQPIHVEIATEAARVAALMLRRARIEAAVK